MFCFFSQIPDSSIADASDSMETHSNADTEHSVNSSSDQSDRKAPCVAEAALRDGEKDFQDGLYFIENKAAKHVKLT